MLSVELPEMQISSGIATIEAVAGRTVISTVSVLAQPVVVFSAKQIYS